MRTYKKITLSLLCGLLGCVCFGVGDWLMLYGDTTYSGTISWLTTGGGANRSLSQQSCYGTGLPRHYPVRDRTVCNYWFVGDQEPGQM